MTQRRTHSIFVNVLPVVVLASLLLLVQVLGFGLSVWLGMTLVLYAVAVFGRYRSVVARDAQVARLDSPPNETTAGPQSLWTGAWWAVCSAAGMLAGLAVLLWQAAAA